MPAATRYEPRDNGAVTDPHSHNGLETFGHGLRIRKFEAVKTTAELPSPGSENLGKFVMPNGESTAGHRHIATIES